MRERTAQHRMRLQTGRFRRELVYPKMTLDSTLTKKKKKLKILGFTSELHQQICFMKKVTCGLSPKHVLEKGECRKEKDQKTTAVIQTKDVPIQHTKEYTSSLDWQDRASLSTDGAECEALGPSTARASNIRITSLRAQGFSCSSNE